MKYIFSILIISISFSAMAQQQYEVSRDDTYKILNGIISKDILLQDTAFAWFAANQKSYVPNPEGLALLKANKDSLRFVVFGGTWCDDTHYILPKFFVLLKAAGISEDRVTLIAVDHNKKSVGNLADAFALKNVPTFIVMKNGKELGRVVEYGKTGVWDREIGEVLR
jgi:thiol-disulfide isomerase/thioredoxin